MAQYVIFASEAAFNTAHDAAKLVAGLPRVGRRNGVLAPESQQTTEITSCTAHPSDGTFVAHINGGWPEGEQDGFAFKTKEEVSAYFPVEEE